MANVIDTLIVELALDPTKFTQGQQAALNAARQLTQQMQQHAKQQEAAGAQIVHFLEQAKRSALEAAGLFIGGKTLAEMVQMEAAMVRNARTIGISTEQLAKWGYMARTVGSDLQSVTGSMQGLQDQISRAQLTGDWGNLLQIFGRFGINLKTTKDGLVDIDALMEDLNATFSKMDPATARAILSMLGLDTGTINLLIQQRSEFAKSREEARALARGFEQAAQESEQLDKAWNKLVGTMELWFAAMRGRWAPELTAFVDKIREWFNLTSPRSEAAGDRAVETSRGMMNRFLGPSPWQDPDAGPPLSIAPGGGDRPMARFLRATGFLESDLNPNAFNPAGGGTGARGILQFRGSTAQQAINMGYGDPRVGSAAEQFAAAEQWLRMFKPEAAAAIDAGDFKRAEELLKGTWTSLPGGKEQQSEGRMRQFESILAGGGPGSGGATTTSTTTSTTNIGTVNVTISGADSPEETGRSVYRWFQRFQHGAAGYQGPH